MFHYWGERVDTTCNGGAPSHRYPHLMLLTPSFPPLAAVTSQVCPGRRAPQAVANPKVPATSRKQAKCATTS